MTNSEHRRGRVLLIAALAGGGLAVAQLAFLAALAAAEHLLVVRTRHATADVLVVPGGDGPARAAEAAALYQEGVARHILVTGEGDCYEISDLMVAAGVPRTAITVECVSRNTLENARLSSSILVEMGVHRAVLVTSWFHTRRALACFQMAVPQVRWMSAPVERDLSVWALARHEEGLRVAQEYLKIGWYVLYHGVDLPATHAPDGKFHRSVQRSHVVSSAKFGAAMSIPAVRR